MIKNSLGLPWHGSLEASSYCTGFWTTGAAFFLGASLAIASPRVGKASVVFTIFFLGTNSAAPALNVEAVPALSVA